MEDNQYAHFITNQLIETWSEISKQLLQQPDKLTRCHLELWKDYQELLQHLTDNVISIDKRFTGKAWQEQILFNFIQRAYFLLTTHIDNLIKNSSGNNKESAKKLHFFAKQFLDSIAPTNFISTNPEIITRTIETQGKNLVNGLKQFLNDIKQNNGQWLTPSVNLTSFEIGKNIACTPGKIVFQNDLIQLIQYNVTAKKTYKHPLLIIPPWINKYYILDLQQENSLVKWLVDQGFLVFMISWVNPETAHREKQFSHYLIEGPIAALKIIQEITNQPQVNVLGYCIGGTLLSCMLAYLAKKNNHSIRSATFLTTLIDFSEPGDLGVFIGDKQINELEKHMQPKGYLDGHVMAAVFNALRANDLIWSSFITTYLKGQKPKPLDLLYWNYDSTNIPEKVHSFYLRNMYLNNKLIHPNQLKLADEYIDLNKITTPCYFLATKDDHIIPWASCYKSSLLLSGPVRFVLASSGHVAGVVNHPGKNKYGFWTYSKRPLDPESYLKNATFHEGSWWPHWINWLKPYAGRLINTKHANARKNYIIEDAPGSYVKKRLITI
ncbi:MAG: hypothetical protein A3E83_08780 [Gammaproteobacteria bacterium RIFCSPHIGHO2_12_FULL_41_20]|nr:MAG: hypothetical protein A3E83_08780 [Gammaproteobacteria bacterium RIFCSPHIGHO2_12_FULL_41_20]